MNSEYHKNLNVTNGSTFETQGNSHLLLISVYETVLCAKCYICDLYESHLTATPIIPVSSTWLHISWASGSPAVRTVEQSDNSN